MKQYNAKKILNIALAGHGGCGKTSVAESMIYLAKASERLGNIADGNTVLIMTVRKSSARLQF